jgi:hypothetical protein
MTEPNGNTQSYRISQIERRLDTFSSDTAKWNRNDEQINGTYGLNQTIAELREEIKTLRRALYTVGAGVVLSAITFAFTVLSSG